MGPSFFIAIAIGVAIAALTWKLPELEFVWGGIGTMISMAQSGFVLITLTPQPSSERVYVDGPIPLYIDRPLPKTMTLWDYVVGIAIDGVATVLSAAALLLICLAIFGKEEAKKLLRSYRDG
jgi:hypothetical protein